MTVGGRRARAVVRAHGRHAASGRGSGLTEQVPMMLIAIYVIGSSAVPYMYGTALAGAGFLALILLIVRQRQIPPRVAWLWPLGLGALGILGFVVGEINGNAGARATLTIYVIEPVVLGVLFACASLQPRWRWWAALMLDAAVVVVAAMSGVVYLMAAADWAAPAVLFQARFTYVDLRSVLPINNYQGNNALVFLFAYAVMRSLDSREPRWRRVVVASCAVAAVAVSGRAVLFLMVPVAMILIALALTVRRKWWRRLPRRVWSGGVFGAGLAAVGGLAVLVWMTADSAASGGPIRAEQSARLLAHWLGSPVWGWGSGAVLDGYSRNYATAWTYELSYHVLLKDFGLVGVALLGAWAWWMQRHLFSAFFANDRLVQAVTAGWVTTLLSAVTNPYLFKIEGMWMVMIPFGFAVSLSTRQSRETTL